MKTHGVLVLCGLAFAAAAPLAAQNPAAAPLVPRGVQVRALTDTLVGAVGGVTVDRSGSIFVADFRDKVYRVEPDGRVSVFATGLYGASGNAIDSQGRLLQSNFYGNTVSRVTRDGHVSVFATGFNGPVGIAVGPGDTLTVNNCAGNTLSRVTPDGTVSPFAASPLLKCPNGITRGPDGTFYVANFRDGNVLAVSPQGEVRVLASLPGGGNAHVTFIGRVTPVAGTGRPGEANGPAAEATFTFPNGIAAGPQGDRLYVNDFVNRFPPTLEVPPVPRTVVRQITLPQLSDMMLAALQAGGVDSLRAVHASWKANPATAPLFTELDVNALGYRLMGAGQLPAAIAVFELNTRAYPNSANTWDSQGEGYMNAGRRADAIRSYEHSLQLNPGNTNATEMLRRLRSR